MVDVEEQKRRGRRARSKTACAQCCFNRCLISLLAAEGCDFALLGWECRFFRPRTFLPEQPRANVPSCSCLGFLRASIPRLSSLRFRLLDIKQFSPPLRIRALLSPRPLTRYTSGTLQNRDGHTHRATQPSRRTAPASYGTLRSDCLR